MDKRRFDDLIRQESGIYKILAEMNDELNRLIKFAKNSNTFGNQIFPDLVSISEDKK